MNFKKSQEISFDLIIALVLLMLFAASFIGLTFNLKSKDVVLDDAFEIEYVLSNLEHNLRIYPINNPSSNIDFIENYRVDKTKLQKFYNQFKDKSVDEFIVGNVQNAHGIGLDEAAFDICLYMTDNDGSRITIDGISALGLLKSNRLCNEKIAEGNPCNDYENAISVFKPVLFNQNDTKVNRIVQLNIVLCRI